MSEAKPKPAAPMSINLALAAIIRDMSAIAKDRKNEQQGFKFRGIDDVYNALHPIFAAHGVVCVPFFEKLDLDIPGKNTKGNNIYRSIVTMGYRFTASDGSTVEAKMVGEGMDYADKATAKAMSVAHKYLLLQTFLIPTEDLVDGDFYDPTVMPREELKRLEEQRAKEAVLAGGAMELPESQAQALQEKRDALTGDLPEGATTVEGKTLPPVENPDAPAHPVAPEGKKSVERRPRQPRTVAPAAPEVGAPGKGADALRAPIEPPAAPAAWGDYVIEFITLHLNKKLSELSPDDIATLKTKWVDRYADRIKVHPGKTAEAAAIMLAFSHHFPA